MVSNVHQRSSCAERISTRARLLTVGNAVISILIETDSAALRVLRSNPGLWSSGKEKVCGNHWKLQGSG